MGVPGPDLFQRRAAGTGGEVQRIAANVDTLFIVTSANRDFNVARLERYLAIAQDAGVFPVIVITKADEADAPGDYVARAAAVSPGILVEVLDARDPEQVDVLRSWCEEGQTIALLGSSGVGKSTLVKCMMGFYHATQGQLMVDGREGLTAADEYVAELARKNAKRSVLVVNKAEGLEATTANADFYGTRPVRIVGSHVAQMIGATRFETRAKGHLGACFNGVPQSYVHRVDDRIGDSRPDA